MRTVPLPLLLRGLLGAAPLLLPGCSSEGGGAGVGEVPCGDKRCGPTEYCEALCTCCGVPTFDGGPQPSAAFTCRPIPAGCSGVSFCSCDAAVRGNLCEMPRTVSIPCA